MLILMMVPLVFYDKYDGIVIQFIDLHQGIQSTSIKYIKIQFIGSSYITYYLDTYITHTRSHLGRQLDSEIL